MGPVSVLYIAFASFSLFACILQLLISHRKSRDVLFLIGSILSFMVFIKFTILVLCTTPVGTYWHPFTLLKYQLIFSQIVTICMLGVLYHLLNQLNKTFILINILLLGLLALISLIVPDHVLFGENATIRHLTLPLGDKIIMITPGFTLWRIFKDITILIFVVAAFLLLLKKLNEVIFRTIALLFTGVAVVLLAALFDQLIDLGQVNTTYMLPFATFFFYIILTFIPFIILIDESIKQNVIIQHEKKLQYLVNQADVIVVGLNRMGVVESMNPYFYSLTGYKEEEVIGKDWFEFFIPPKEYYNVQGTFVEILESEFHAQYLNPILTKNKEEKLIRWFNVRTHNRQGKISGSLSIGIDVSQETREHD